jgi:hypothetical protein
VRAVQILPTKLLGVVADHRDWPVERIAVGGGTAELSIDKEASNDDEEWHGISAATSKTLRRAADSTDEGLKDSALPRRWWVGSVGHEDGLRLTDLMAFFHDLENADTRAMGVDDDSGVEDGNSEARSEVVDEILGTEVGAKESDEEIEEEQVQISVKRKKKVERDSVQMKHKRGKKNAVVVEDASFFGDL